MSARRRGRTVLQRHPALAAAAALALVLIAAPAAHALGWLVLLAAAGVAGYALGARRRPVARVTARPGPPAELLADRDRLAIQLEAEREQHAAEVGALGRQLAEARDVAHAAWDAAASRPPTSRPSPWECPRCHCLFERPGFDHEPCSARRAALLADPRGGARPLIGGD